MKQAAVPPPTWIKLAVYHLLGETALAHSKRHMAEEPVFDSRAWKCLCVTTQEAYAGSSPQVHTLHKP